MGDAGFGDKIVAAIRSGGVGAGEPMASIRSGARSRGAQVQVFFVSAENQRGGERGLVGGGIDPAAHVAALLAEHRQPLLLPGAGAAPASPRAATAAVPRLVGLLLPGGGGEVRRRDVLPRRGRRGAAAVAHGRARSGVGPLGFVRHWARGWGRGEEDGSRRRERWTDCCAEGQRRGQLGREAEQW